MSSLKQSVVRVASWEGRLLPGGVRLGEQVAHGGFGVVHRGWREPGGTQVAVKLLLGARDDERVAAFRAEMQLLATLRHPSIAAIVASGVAEEDGLSRPWMAIEWCEGRTLATELSRRAGKKHTRAEAWALLGPIVEAVAFAHTRGCIHRDLKPANIMLVSDPSASPEGLRPVLIDWGIGKRVAPDARVGSGETATQSHMQAYTEAYAAPEQLAGTRTGPWTDVHALGLLLTELLVGERPYGKGSGIFAIVDPTRPTPKTFGVDAGPWEPVLAAAMALHAPQRFRSATELAGALLAADPSVRAAPASRRGPTAPVSSSAPVHESTRAPLSSLPQAAGPARGSVPLPSVTARPETVREPPAGPHTAAPAPVRSQEAPRPFPLLPVAAVGVAAVALGIGGTLLWLSGTDPSKGSKRRAPARGDAVGQEAPLPASTGAPASQPAPPAAPARAIGALDDLDDDAVVERGKAAKFAPVGEKRATTSEKAIMASFSFLQGSDVYMVARHRYTDPAWIESIWKAMCLDSGDKIVCARAGKTIVFVHGLHRAAQVALRDALVAGIPNLVKN